MRAGRARRHRFSTFRDLEQGNLSPGEKHLATFLRSVQGGYPIPSATMKFLKGAIQRLFAGDKPAKAFDLNTKRGARGVPASVYDQIAREVYFERMAGATYEEGVEVVASRRGLSRNTVTDYYSRSKASEGVPEEVVPLARPHYPDDPVERVKFLGVRKKKH